jgi:hypothetical protein
VKVRHFVHEQLLTEMRLSIASLSTCDPLRTLSDDLGLWEPCARSIDHVSSCADFLVTQVYNLANYPNLWHWSVDPVGESLQELGDPDLRNRSGLAFASEELTERLVVLIGRSTGFQKNFVFRCHGYSPAKCAGTMLVAVTLSHFLPLALGFGTVSIGPSSS